MSLISESLFGGELGAVALGELLHGVFALVDERAQHFLLFGLGQGLALVDLLAFQRGFDHAQGLQLLRFAGLHGGDDVCVEFLQDAHTIPPLSCTISTSMINKNRCSS